MKTSNTEIEIESCCFDLEIDRKADATTPKGYVSFVATNHAGQTLHGEFSMKNLNRFIADVNVIQENKTI